MNCKPLLEAINKYIAKEDGDLNKTLDKAGFADTAETVDDIAILEEKIAKALVSETKFIKSKIKKAANLEVFASDIFSEIQNDDDVDEKLKDIFLESFNDNMPKLAEVYVKKIDSALTVKTITDRTTAWAENWSGELGKIMKLDTHTEIQRILVDNLKNGKSIAEFTRDILNSKVRDEYYRARRAAITEMLRAHSVAQQEAIVQNPSAEHKEWVHTGSYRNTPRKNHEDLNGVIVPKDEPFTLIGTDGLTYYPMYPRDSILPPGESVNCHCIHRGIASDEVLGMPLEERRRLQQEAIDADNGEWEKELDAANKLKAGISENPVNFDDKTEKGIDKFNKIGYNKKEGKAQGKYTAKFNSFIDKQKDMPNDYKAMLKERFAGGTPQAQKVFTKFVKKNIVVDTAYQGTAGFNPSKMSIRMNYSKDIVNPKTPGTTYFHEHGHYIDLISARNTGYERTSIRMTVKDGNFGEALQNDFKTFLKTYKKENGFLSDDNAYTSIGLLLENAQGHNSAISDLMGGLTGNRISNGYKHEKDYWKHINYSLEKEAFAHMTEAQFSKDRYNLMKQYFPTSLAEYERILRSLAI